MTYSPNRPEMRFVGDKITNFEARHGQAVYAIVQHVMGRNAAGDLGTMPGTKSHFENPASKVSAHFGVGFDGTIWQFVSLTKAAWANGILEDPDLAIDWLAECVREKLNPNWRTISIEHEGDGVMPMPEKQYQASLALNRWLCSLNGIRPGTRTIIRHSQITGRQRANCPGKSFPLIRLLADLGAIRNNMPATFKDPVTGITVNETFATFYRDNGGLAIFGRPISDVKPGNKRIDCDYYQWFERARFEKRGLRIDLGLVGRESMAYDV